MYFKADLVVEVCPKLHIAHQKLNDYFPENTFLYLWSNQSSLSTNTNFNFKGIIAILLDLDFDNIPVWQEMSTMT